MNEKKIAKIAKAIQVRAFHNTCVYGEPGSFQETLELWGIENKPQRIVEVDQALAGLPPLIEDFRVSLDIVRGAIDTACPKDYTFVLTKKALKTNVINTLEYLVSNTVGDSIIRYHVNGGSNSLYLSDVMGVFETGKDGFDVNVQVNDPAWYYLLDQVAKKRFCHEKVVEVGRYLYTFTAEPATNPTIGADAIIKFARVG